MANLRERAQMILVGGLAIAVGIVVLVVLLNSVIYTQNVATRGDTGATEDVMEYRAAVVEEVGNLVDAENDRPYESRAPLAANVSAGVATVAEALQDQVARTLTSTQVDTTLHEGTRVVQSDATRNLTAADTDANWTVATGANGVRAFVVTPTDVRGNLLTLDPTTDSTRIEVTGAGGNTWRLHVYEEAATGQHYLAVKNGSGSLTDRPCGGIDMGEPIDLSAGTVDGADCPALSFAEGTTAPWTVSVVYGNHTDANYTVTLNTTTAESEVAGPAAGTSPHWEPVVYSLALELTVQRPELAYAARVRVAPGEDDA